MKKVLILDLNGVVIIGKKLSDRFEETHSIGRDRFLPVLKETMAKIRMPDADSVYSYWKPHLENWNINMTEQEFEDFWFSAEKENTEMTDLIRELKGKGMRSFILSNNFKERAAYYESHFPFLRELFEKVYYSWRTGFVKPDRRAYELILSENNLDPKDCIYFDDSNENIEVAKSLGIESHIYEGTDSMRKVIEK